MGIILIFCRLCISCGRFLFFGFLWKILQLGFAEFLKNINDIICTIDLYGI